MELTDKDIQQIEAYWQEQLSETERLAFENRLESDLVFRQEAIKMHLITEGLDVLKKRQLRQRLQELDATLPPIDPPNSMGWLKIVLVVLALALATFSVWYFMIRAEKSKISGPIAAVFEPYPALGITMGDDEKTVRLEALKKYAKKDYKNAIPLLDKAFAVEKDSLLLFYKGIAHIGDGESSKAIPLLENLKTSSLMSPDTVEWFLALAYLETNQKDKATIILKKVANTEGGKYQAKATELIQKMNLNN
jgi:tetratricopeptide (TPR) repeat protein